MGRRTLSLSTGEVEVDIVRSGRRTVALYVRPGGTLLIRAPWYVPVRMLMNFAAEKSRWIERQVTRLKNVTPPGEAMTVSDGTTVPFLGRELTVTVKEGSRRMVSHVEGSLILTTKGITIPGELARMTEAWYLREARGYLTKRTEQLAAEHYRLIPSPATIKVRKMKRRWGTCHTSGVIWLNRELIKKDPGLIDYVIIHELCHLVHHNHGRDYYELLARIMPDYQERRKRLQL